MYASVVIDTGGRSGLDCLTYEIPDDLAGRIVIGSCVLVPLGSRQAVGYVVGISPRSDVDETRQIISELESPVALTQEMLGFARWVSSEYLCPLPRAILGMLPGVMHLKVRCCITAVQQAAEPSNLSPVTMELLDRIREHCEKDSEGPTIEALCKGRSRSTVLKALRDLESVGLVKRAWRLGKPVGRPRCLRGVRVAGPVDPSGLPEGQARALQVISSLGRDVSFVELERSHGLSRAAVNALLSKGLVEEAVVNVRRDPGYMRVDQQRPQLMPEQELAVARIVRAVDESSYHGFLLHGVTASGKTEVYLRCIEHALHKNKSCLVLLPEIAVTTQLMSVFRTRLGDSVAVLHSALSPGERCGEWSRIYRGEARVAVGARSAVFAPLSNLGLVIVDEEHDSSYKQDTAPRYHGRDTAVERARRQGAALVLGSATPSVESYYKARKGDYELLEMPTRVENRPMPAVHLVDMRREYAEAGPTVFSRVLDELIRDRLERRQQVILLQNRRAYSTFLLCRDCGYVPKCSNCAVSLKFYSESKRLSCHHCEYALPAPTVCPNCGGLRIGRFGIGTERVAEEASKSFPSARVLRMDSDTTSRKGSHAAMLDAVRSGQADILVGTQMIAKGLDFPNVTLVGVISADTSLNLPDFTASERTFQLVSQVSGRSGRGSQPGEVVVQTFDPENHAIACAVAHDYSGFYETEIANREEAGYPPFVTLVNIVAWDTDEKAAEAVLRELVSSIDAVAPRDGGVVTLHGPVPAVLSRLRGEYRWHVVIRSADRRGMLALLQSVFESRPGLRRKLSVDVDPVSML